jgi:enoyl-CoA hydratase/carnithine racemase
MSSQQLSPPPFEAVVVDVDGPIGRLTLNRPAKRNALSTVVLNEIADAAAWFDRRSDVRVVVVSGAGDHFCAGADLESFSGEKAPRTAGDAGRVMADALEAMRPLAIAAIKGWCVGGGVVLAAACDLRIAADDARFSIPEVDLGIPLAWGGIPRLVREIGPTRTKELVITCRVFDAAEAHQIGFLNQIVPAAELDATVRSLAERIVAKAPLAVEATKRHTNAVTAQMVGIGRAWSDADSLAAALHDPECIAAREAYLAGRANRSRPSR